MAPNCLNVDADVNVTCAGAHAGCTKKQAPAIGRGTKPLAVITSRACSGR